jgi:hypothetical protein
MFAIEQFCRKWFWGINFLIALVALFLFFVFYEHFPRPGWVDAGMYSGYVFNQDLYKSYPLVAHNYQGSRLGFLFPLRLITGLFGDYVGREIFSYALYLFCALSLTVIAEFAMGRSLFAAMFSVLFMVSPLLISSITYGGADGPAATFALVSIALFAKSIKLSCNSGSVLLGLSSGLFAALSISSHIFAVLPLGVAFCYFCFLCKSERRILVLLGYMFLGFSGCLSGLAFLGYKLGLDRFFLLYSLPWIDHSFSGSGYSFEQPKEEWLNLFKLWIPLYAVAVCALLLIFFRRVLGIRPSLGEFYGVCALIVIFSFFFAFDNLLGGNLMGTPAYLNIVFPCVFFGLVFAFSGNKITYARNNWFEASSIIVVLGLLLINIFVQFESQHIQSLLASNSLDSHDLYQSQIEFVREIKQKKLMNPQIKFVYVAADQNSRDVRIYSDYFGGKRRGFDYIDSISSLFLWDRSIAARIIGDFDKISIDMNQHDHAKLVVLARNMDEILRIGKSLKTAIGGQIGEPVCRSSESYPWCFVEWVSD